jgi:hypothetical protein
VSAFVPLVMMAVVGPIGAFDVLYFHLWKFRLASRADSRAETLTHVARGLLVGTVVWTLAHFEAHGAWFWALAVALVFDFLNNVADVALEPDSRAALGGLPRVEYLIHILGATADGAVAATVLVLGWGLSRLSTALVPASPLPLWLVIDADATAVGGWALAVFETALLARAWFAERQSAEAAT